MWKVRGPLIFSTKRYYSSSFGSEHTYSKAIESLNTIQSNHAAVMLVQQDPEAMFRVAMPEMLDWIRKAGYSASDFDALNAIHIAGTKGKGSTASFVSSILAQYLPGASSSPLLQRIGLYTSPHLRFVRERIQINNQFLSEKDFASGFFEIWNRFEEAQRAEGPANDGSTKPMYFRFLTILAYHTFLKMGVDTAVVECGLGGEYDSTNILVKPSVVAITNLGIDHTAMLGKTIDKIAWHKAGIMKTGTPAYTVAQPPEAMKVLEQVAHERDVDLRVVPMHPEIEHGNTALGLSAPFQKINASLAVEVAAAHLRRLGHNHISTERLPKEFLVGLENAHLGGRCETRYDDVNNIAWRIDGAHTKESLEVAGKWYADCVLAPKAENAHRQQQRILLFNQQARPEASLLLRGLYETIAHATKRARPFDHVIFCTNKTFKESGYRPDMISNNTDAKATEQQIYQEGFRDTWKKLDEGLATSNPSAEIHIRTTIEEAIQLCRQCASKDNPSTTQTEILVTGSLHLVGGVLEVLESESEIDIAQ